MMKELFFTGLTSITIGFLLFTNCNFKKSYPAHLYTDPQYRFRIACPDSGWTLYTQTEGQEKNFGGLEVLGGYLVGAITGSMMGAASKGRNKHKQLLDWEESLREEKPESSLNI